jgi:hypothetical protein
MKRSNLSLAVPEFCVSIHEANASPPSSQMVGFWATHLYCGGIFLEYRVDETVFSDSFIRDSRSTSFVGWRSDTFVGNQALELFLENVPSIRSIPMRKFSVRGMNCNCGIV